MKQALFVVSGVAIGLLAALVAVGCSKSELMAQAEAQAGPGGAGAPNGMGSVMGIGGASNNINDICWVMSKFKPARGPERTVLLMYRAEKGGEHFNLKDARFLDGDMRLFEYAKHEPSVQGILKNIDWDEAELIKPPPCPPKRNP